MLHNAGCELLEVASTLTLTDKVDKSLYADEATWQKIKILEFKICTKSELLGMDAHLLFVARKFDKIE